MADAKTLTPPADHVITKVMPLEKSSVIASDIKHKTSDSTSSDSHKDEGSGTPVSTLALRPYHRKIQEEQSSKGELPEKHLDIDNQKYIMRRYRQMMLFFKSPLYPQMVNKLDPLMLQLLKLRNGRPLTFDDLRVLFVHYVRYGMDVNYINRPALENPALKATYPGLKG